MGEKDEQGKVKKRDAEEAEEGEIKNGKDEGKENVKKDKKVEGSKKDEDILSVKESDDNTSQHTEVIDDSSEMEVGTKVPMHVYTNSTHTCVSQSVACLGIRFPSSQVLT